MTTKYRNYNTFSLMLAIFFIAVILLVIAFPKKQPLRRIMPSFTEFDSVLDKYSMYITHSLRRTQGEAGSLYKTIRRNPSSGGRSLEMILDAAYDEDAYCTPLFEAFIQESVDKRFKNLLNHSRNKKNAEGNYDSGKVSAMLASPAPLNYGGNQAEEIRAASEQNWRTFPTGLRSMVTRILEKALQAAESFDTVKAAVGSKLKKDNDLYSALFAQDGLLFEKDHAETLLAAGKIGEDLDFSTSWRSLHAYCTEIDEMLHKARECSFKINAPPIQGDDWFPNGVLYAAQTPYGKVIIGGEQNNLYPAGDIFLLIDLGGKDTYYFDETFLPPEKGGFPVSCSTVLDMNGDDVYKGGAARLAAGFLGYQSILDLKGNDHYIAKGMGLGAGLLGLGLLVDAEGNDSYHGEAFCLGAAAFGAGFLMDGGGDDIYRSTGFSKGFAGPKGLGCLVESFGDDIYCAFPPIADTNSKDAAGQPIPSYSQGCSASFDSRYGGGVALLIDLLGDDSYRCETIGQGAASGRGVGLLLDSRGADYYFAKSKCQGFGCSGGIGILRDTFGSDKYNAGELSQGAGEEASLGILIDDTGNDLYAASGIAQGDNHPNGIGILSDKAGYNQFISKQ